MTYCHRLRKDMVAWNWFVRGFVTLLIMYCDCGTCYFPLGLLSITGMSVKVVVNLVEELLHYFLWTEKTTTQLLHVVLRAYRIQDGNVQSLKS
jgi:heterodisulfide reductase subunit B